MGEFVSCFAEVADPRRGNARHNLHEMLLIALCTMLCGGEDCSDMELFGQAKEPFLRQFLRLRHGISSQGGQRGADYVLALKGNQGTLHDDVRRFLNDPGRRAEAAHTAVDAGHGRIETRTSTVCSDIGWLRDLHAWPGLAAIGRVTRTRETGTKTTTEAATTTETAYHLLSAPLSAERFGEVVRAHWGVENGLHWVLDVTMNEDQARTRKDHSPQNTALLRRLALNLAKLEPSKGSMKGKLKRAGWDDMFLTSLLAQFSKTQMR